MELIYLLLVFLCIVIILALKHPLYRAMLGGICLTAVLYRVPPAVCARLIANVFTHWGSLQVLLSLYLITYLQRMLEARQQIKLAQLDLNGLFHNRKVNAGVAPLFIGLLPSAAAMVLCGDIVKEATDGYLEPKEQAFVTTWFRHIPESSLPTYASVLLMMNLAGAELPPFMLAMVVPVCALAGIGYFRYLRRLPSDPGTPVSQNKKLDAIHLFQHLWSLLLIIALILIFKISVVTAVLISIALCIVVYKFRREELVPMLRSAWEKKLLSNTFLVLVFKEFIGYTRVLHLLPDVISTLPIPTFLVFAILFFLGGVISGSQGIIALGTPLAVMTLGNSMSVLVLLMGMAHAAAQISPTHVCIVVASEYYHVSFGEIVKKTLPNSLLFALFVICYYLILRAIL